MKENAMRLVILIYSMSGGGAERVVSYLLPFLKARNIDVHLVLMNQTINYGIPKNIPVYYLEKSRAEESGLSKLAKLPILAYRYAKLLKKIGATHSFSLLTRPNYINVLARKFSKRKYRLIISERSYPSLAYGHGNSKDKINKRLIKILYPTADFIICNSKENRLDLINNFKCYHNKIRVIYNPIDKEKIDKMPVVTNFFDPNFFNAISVGRLYEVKNHELLIRSINRNENIRLYILGSGFLKEQLEKVAIEENLVDRVFFMGFDNNPYKYLKKADLFLLGSNYEGFPNVLLEAMACGLPIVSTNCKSGPSELMELKEEKSDLMFTDYGILVPVNDIDLMFRAIQYMATHQEFLKSCKSNCIERVLDFDRESILEDYISVISNA